MGEENNSKKSWRRITCGAVAFSAITFAFYFCIKNKVAIEWFNTYTWSVIFITLFTSGVIAATDLLDRWKK